MRRVKRGIARHVKIFERVIILRYGMIVVYPKTEATHAIRTNLVDVQMCADHNEISSPASRLPP